MFLQALCLIFITLKLCGVIDWSWWFVLMPLLVCCLVDTAKGYLENATKEEQGNKNLDTKEI